MRGKRAVRETTHPSLEIADSETSDGIARDWYTQQVRGMVLLRANENAYLDLEVLRETVHRAEIQN